MALMDSGMMPRRRETISCYSKNINLNGIGEFGMKGMSCYSIITAINSWNYPDGLRRVRLRLWQEMKAPMRSSSSRRKCSTVFRERWTGQNGKVGVTATKSKDTSSILTGLQAQKLSRKEGALFWSRKWRLMATDEPEEVESDEEGYWEGEEGKQKLQEIEDMLELVAEAENLRKEDSANGRTDESSSKETEKQKGERLREELARAARVQAEQRKQADIMFVMGQRAYGRGVYDKSVELLEAALSNVPASSILGGEIQIWLAMAYEAHNRHSDCIALYKKIEASHPSKQIRRQAADLRYILEAPKLKISKEEMVSIPIIERDYDRGSKTWSQKIRDRRRKPMPVSKSKDYLADWLVWDPPRWERNPYFWVALTVWLTLVGVSLMFQD